MNRVEDLTAGTDVEPRPYQARIVEKAFDLYLTKNLRSVLIESPTGSGKTVMGLFIAAGLQKALGVRVGWVAMRRYLLAQAQEEVRRRRIPVECHFLSMFDREPPADLDILVIDEAQHDAAGSMAHLHAAVRPKRILGLSATPFRADKIKLCFDTVIRDAGIQQLIDDGYLSRFRHYTLPDFEPATVAEFYLKDRARWGRSVFYFHTIPQCRQAVALLRKGGARVELVTAAGDRDDQLARFERGELDALVNCFVLAEGFDCPRLQTVFCRPSGKGITVQMCGRVLRRHPDAPVKNVVQCAKTAWPFVRTASAAQQFVWAEGGWRTLEVNPMIQQAALATLQALARTKVELPAFLAKQQTHSRRRFQAAGGET